ncbi:hypothetical protein C0J52_11593 [Blattella germanica]|nr:hypothetical protein C0J52_11593 [Blattella germanica]
MDSPSTSGAADQDEETEQNVNVGETEQNVNVDETEQNVNVGETEQNVNVEEGNEHPEAHTEVLEESSDKEHTVRDLDSPSTAEVNQEEEQEGIETDSEIKEEATGQETTEPLTSASPAKLQSDKSKKKIKKQQNLEESIQKDSKSKKGKKKGKTKEIGEGEEIVTGPETSEIVDVPLETVGETDEVQGNITEIEDKNEQAIDKEVEGEQIISKSVEVVTSQHAAGESAEVKTTEEMEEVAGSVIDTKSDFTIKTGESRKGKKPKKGKGKGSILKEKEPEVAIELKKIESDEKKIVRMASSVEVTEIISSRADTHIPKGPSTEKMSTGRRKSDSRRSIDVSNKEFSVDELKGKKRKRAQRREKILDAEQLETEERRPSIEGIIPIIINADTQKLVGCVIGEQVTTENPWIQIKRERIEYSIETEEESSIFFAVKDDIKELKIEDIWIGYDSSTDTPDSFFICVTEAANLHVARTVEFTEADRQKRVQESVTRSCRDWTTLGSEKDIEDWGIIDSRPLYRVEAQTTIQKLIVEANFTDFNVEDVFYGYRHILPIEGKIPEQISKTRNDAAVQACSETIDTHSQTYPPLPENSWTQYEQVVFLTEITDEESVKKLKTFIVEQSPFMDKTVAYNSSFDLYKDDYPDLVLKASDKEAPKSLYFKEYASFTDVLHCKDKVISSIAWHPMWTGIVACAYVDHARCINIRFDEGDEDEILRAVHGINPVLIWSFVDSLAPKLVLECSREVHALQFCPFNENILIGGCSNGQVVVWDLTDKLRKVEEIIHLTLEQQMYRETLFSLMKWMKNTRRLDYVTPAAMSSLHYSPTRCITAIQWLSPHFEISRTGKYGELRDNETLSLQFLTSSEDGAVCIWDLQAPISKAAGLSKPRKKKKPRPAALVADVSRFRYLNMVFTPIFRVNIVNPDTEKSLPISTLSSFKVKVDYEQQSSKETALIRTLSERLLFNPVLDYSESIHEQEFYVGTMEGQLILGFWEGYDTNTGEVVNSEISKYKSWGEIHESPVSNISRSPFFDKLILTSSSKVVAIWRVDVHDIPLFWRRSRIRITSCNWSENYPNAFSVLHADGSLEVWNLLARSDKPVMSQSVSGRILTGYNLSKIGPVQNVIGIADHRGALRIFKVPAPEGPIDVSEETKATKKILTREKQKRELFNVWQNEWLERNKEALQAEQDAIEEELQRQEDERKKQEKIEEERREKEEALMRRIQKKEAQNVDIMKQAKERWDEEQQRRYIKIIMEQKKLDKNELLSKIEPLEKIKEHEKKKKDKQSDRLQQRDKIYEDTKNLLFPEMLAIVKRRLFDLNTLKTEINKMEPALAVQYENMEVESYEEIKNKPYKYDFGWRDVYMEGKDSKNIVNSSISNHTARDYRYTKSKNERRLLQMNLEQAQEQEANIQVAERLRASSVQFNVDSESRLNLSERNLTSFESPSRVKSDQGIQSRSQIKSSATIKDVLSSRSQIPKSGTIQEG